jgi:hypothetical protein
VSRVGRPPKPVEEHKRTGTYNATRHGSRTALAVVEPAPVMPHESDPRDVFAQVMAEGVVWLGRTDLPSLAMLQSQLDERALLRADAIAGSTEARKHLRDLDRQIIGLLAELGFNPAARARLGLAEVKAKSKLEELRERQERRK